MYKISQAWFLYAVSPVHMGAGNRVGELVDSPIQREAHTAYPLLPASGIKGALRHRAVATDDSKESKATIAAMFGASPGASELHAGALSMTDGVLVAFPVRTLNGTFCYATSAMALARACRLLQGAGHSPPALPSLQSGPLASESGTRVLETLRYECTASQELAALAGWLAAHAFPDDAAYDYFKTKLASDMVLLPDDDFAHFVRTGTSIEPHVRINDKTGTAWDGGLFYVENLPPESLFLSTALFGDERSGNNSMTAEALAEYFSNALAGQMVQIGGDATYGRGHIVFNKVAE